MTDSLGPVNFIVLLNILFGRKSILCTLDFLNLARIPPIWVKRNKLYTCSYLLATIIINTIFTVSIIM